MDSGITQARPSRDVLEPAAVVPLSLRVNGTEHSLEIDPRTSLLDALREGLDLTGTKKGCNQGACGACTVLVDGERVLACLTLALQCDGRDVTTVEGIARQPLGEALQRAFVAFDGFQCGYCTPGQICSAAGMLDEWRRGVPSVVTPNTADGAELDDEEVKERMSGNLCRCGAYVGICEAIHAAYATTKRGPA